jgi:hypothetical protein
MMRLAIYLVGLAIVAASVWLAGTAFGAFLPVTLIAAVVLLVLGLGVIGAAYMVIDRPIVVRDAFSEPLPRGPFTRERIIDERPVRRETIEERDYPPRRYE